MLVGTRSGGESGWSLPKTPPGSDPPEKPVSFQSRDLGAHRIIRTATNHENSLLLKPLSDPIPLKIQFPISQYPIPLKIQFPIS